LCGRASFFFGDIGYDLGDQRITEEAKVWIE
jgi:hypothetical protein